MNEEQMESVMHENRVFNPPAAFQERAHIRSMETYKEQHRRSLEDPEGFWSEAAESLHWFKKWDRVFDDTEAPFFKWFTGGKTNICYNAVDRWADGAQANKRAIVWEGEPGENRELTFAQLKREVSRFANVLKELGIKKGDSVAIYLPMTPELAIAMLACARIGAVHSVVFGGFSAESLSDRIHDAEAKLLITADGGHRRGALFPLKPTADEAVASCPSIENVLVVKRGEGDCAMKPGRDHWWHELRDKASDECPPNRWTARTFSTSSIPPARPANPRASFTRPAAT
jgi:acetyl-CoA synthetase